MSSLNIITWQQNLKGIFLKEQSQNDPIFQELKLYLSQQKFTKKDNAFVFG